MPNSLVPFEKKFESWELAHPRRWVATPDRAEIFDFLSAQTRKITEAQLEAADRIVVSQGRIADRIDDAVIAVRDVGEGLEELRATFEWGFTELIWQIEQEREVLKGILKVLQAPLDTQAKELRKRAEYAYRNGWIKDALEDFLESEKKNRYDFTIHQNLGNIYLFEQKNPEKALEYYEKAAKYATPKSSYYTSISLLHIGLVKYLQEDFRGAYKATSRATELSPNLYEAHYQHAQYCAKIGPSYYNEAIEHLRTAIVDGDKYYCAKADSERDFNAMKLELRSLFEDLRNKAKSQAKLEIEEAEKLIHNAKSYGVKESRLWASEKALKESKTFLRRDSLFDCWDAVSKVYNAEKKAAHSSVEYLYEEIRKLENESTKLTKKIEKEKDGLAWGVGVIYLSLTILATALSKLSAGAKAGLIFVFIISSPFVAGVAANIDAKRRVSLSFPPLIKKKNKLEEGFVKIKSRWDRLRREGNRKLPKGFRPKSREKEEVKKGIWGKRLEEMNGEELLEALEAEEGIHGEAHEHFNEVGEQDFQRLAEKIRKRENEQRKRDNVFLECWKKGMSDRQLARKFNLRIQGVKAVKQRLSEHSDKQTIDTRNRK